MKITKITAVPISFRIPEGGNVTLGIGRAVKRDAVLVRVDGIPNVGHDARSS